MSTPAGTVDSPELNFRDGGLIFIQEWGLGALAHAEAGVDHHVCLEQVMSQKTGPSVRIPVGYARKAREI